MPSARRPPSAPGWPGCTFAPDLVLTDGDAALVAGAPPLGASPSTLVLESHMPYRKVFDVVWSGRRNLIMMASQIDRSGNQNISAIGDWARPKAQLVGVRGAPGNTVNHSTSYWVPNHSTRSFVEQVDVVCGVGYAAGGGGRSGGQPLPRDPARRVQPRRLRLRDARQGHADPLGPPWGDGRGDRGRHRVRSGGPRDVPDTRRPPPTSSQLIRDVLDPRGMRDREVPDVSDRTRPLRTRRRTRAARDTRFCRLVGVRYPIVQTGHGLGGRAPAGGRHRRGRRPRASWPRPP